MNESNFTGDNKNILITCINELATCIHRGLSLFFLPPYDKIIKKGHVVPNILSNRK